MTTERALGPGTVTIDGDEFETLTVEVGSKRFTVRELTVEEGDQALVGARQPDNSINETLNTRMLLSMALVEPATTVDRIGKLKGREYVAVLRAFNDLNSLPVGNPTPPAGSAGPTSPSGGEQSPTISPDSEPASTSEWSGSQPTP